MKKEMPLKNYPGYSIDKKGNVYSDISNWRGYGRRKLKQSKNAYGYNCVRMTVGTKRLRQRVHKLMADTFLPPKPTPNYEMRHLDGNKSNNNLSNLAWGTAKDNANDREKHGRTSRGKKHSEAIKRGRYAKRKK